MGDHPSERRQGAGWACVCDQCAQGRQARPPTAEDLIKYADLIAERNRVGQAPIKRRRRRRPEAHDEPNF